ncbi:TPA: DUF1840 family protein [Photobacterium damselae]
MANAEPAISIIERAYPLLELLKTAIEGKCDVMWETLKFIINESFLFNISINRVYADFFNIHYLPCYYRGE